jgi:DNA modification methylase
MIINDDCLEAMKKMEDNSISCIVCDPPYALTGKSGKGGFMGKEWDSHLPSDAIWKEALRIAKPGSFLLAFGGTRTYHRLTSSIEDAGWEIRDCLLWLFASGFPKSHNHFGIPGFGTALKPAYEPIIMAMKPCEGTFKQNAEKWGQAGINIDECRIPGESWGSRPAIKLTSKGKIGGGFGQTQWESKPGVNQDKGKGRWPANILFDEESSEQLDSMTGFEASRFFYCAKTSSRERNEGLEGMEDKTTENAHFATPRLNDLRMDNEQKRLPKKNNHPTVKPLKLMRYLITLVMPPKDGVLLDPFAGSGSTIVAAHQLGLKAIGIEKSADYCEIARKRLEHVEKIKEEPKDLDLFGT